MLDLLVLSNAVNFVGVAMALWLGFFNLTRSPQLTLTRVAALTMWAGGGYMLSSLMYYNQLPEDANFYWSILFRCSTFFGPALTVHLTACFLPAAVYRRRRWILVCAYLIAAIWTIADTNSPVLLSAWNKASPLAGNSRVPGALYPFFILYLLACVALIGANLFQAYNLAGNQALLRRHIRQALIASALLGAGIMYLTLNVQLRLDVPNVIGDLLLIGALGLMGYTVAREAARRDGRSVQRDFFYTLLAISLICAAYLAATMISYVIYGLPFVTFIFVLMLAVSTHSVYDWARSALDRIFFQRPTRELRAGLRALAHEAGNDHDLHQNLLMLLSTLCQSVNATRGVLLLRQDDRDGRPSASGQDDSNVLHRRAEDLRPSAGGQEGHYVVDAAYHMTGPAQPIPLAVVTAQDITPFDGTGGLSGLSLLAPLRLVDQQVGALLLGPKESGSPYGAGDEDLIADVADSVEVVIAQMTVQAERTRQLTEQVARYRESERELQAEVKRQIEAIVESPMALAGFSEKELLAQGEDALRHLSDIPYLSELALCRLPAVTRQLQPAAATKLDRGRALKDVLLDTLNKLRPADTPEPKQPGSEWHPYLILRDAYVDGVPNREIMVRLFISDGTFSRTRRRAVRAVARALVEMEAADSG